MSTGIVRFAFPRGGRGRKEMLGGAVHAQGQGRDICLPHHVDKAGLSDGCQVRFLRQAEEVAPPTHHLQHQQGAGFLDNAPHADGERATGHKTIIRMNNQRFNVKVAPNLFTISKLERGL
jgi:hypothetical protein